MLGAEEELARALLDSLNDLQLGTAIIDSEAPSDILTGADSYVRLESPSGLSGSDMDETQQQSLLRLVSDYIYRMPQDVADSRMNRIEEEGRKHIHFAWAGSKERERPHYYRVHGPGFLIEYDNTRNNANHIHSVWRDLWETIGARIS